jgi:hypothetical protein
MFEPFKNIYLIQNDYQDLQKVPIFDDHEAAVILLSNKVKHIQNSYFSGFENLETVSIFIEIEEINGSFFSWCHQLKEIRLPPTLKKIKGACFMEKQKLTKINIPRSVVEIGISCFRETNVFSEEGVMNIEEGYHFCLEQIMQISRWDNEKKVFY